LKKETFHEHFFDFELESFKKKNLQRWAVFLIFFFRRKEERGEAERVCDKVTLSNCA